LSSFDAQVEYISVKNKPFKPMEENPKKLPLPLEARGLPSNKPIPRPTPLTTPTSARSIHALSHNYATKAPLVTMVWPKFTPKTSPSPSTITTRIHASLYRLHSLPQMASGSNQSFCHSTLSSQTVRETNEPTDRHTDRPMV